MRNRIFFHLALFVEFLALLIILAVGYVNLWPVEIISNVKQPYKVITPEVKQGEDMIYIADHCKLKEAGASIQRSLTDGIVIPLPEKPSNLPIGCHRVPIHVFISTKVPPGKYYMTIDIEYKINSFRSVFYHLKTEQFKGFRK